MAKFIVDPRQNRLFDIYDEILSDTAKRRLQSSWHFLFRQTLLQLMPAGELGEHFDPEIGRPTKELYSMAGLLLIKEFKNLNSEQAADTYMFDVAIQYALNLQPERQSLCERTIKRYLKIFRENDFAKQIMQQVTLRLVELLELDISKQRLDSTHVQSDMAAFGRTRLMGVAIKNFLTQLKRHDEPEYLTLPETLRERYLPSRALLFGGWKKEEDWSKTRQQVAEEMHLLVERFAANPTHNGRSTYQTLCTVFSQQCEVKLDKVTIRKHPGGNIIVNPSDPDATLDGHKGSGYQIQLSETCSDANETQLIVSAIPQQAHQSDAGSLKVVLADLKEQGMLPQQMLADTSYGSDANAVLCEREGIDLVAPLPGKAPAAPPSPDDLTAADFEVSEREKIHVNGERRVQPMVSVCPGGYEPFASNYDRHSQAVHVYQLPEVCHACPLWERCPVHLSFGLMTVKIAPKEVRLTRRRQRQQTPEFQQTYRKRSGLEATNSIVKRMTGMARLGVRGKPSVFNAMLLKVAGFNILRGATNRTLMGKLLKQKGGFGGWFCGPGLAPGYSVGLTLAA